MCAVGIRKSSSSFHRLGTSHSCIKTKYIPSRSSLNYNFFKGDDPLLGDAWRILRTLTSDIVSSKSLTPD